MVRVDGESSLHTQRTSKPGPLRPPGVKGPGGHCVLTGDRSPVLNIMGAPACPRPGPAPRPLTFRDRDNANSIYRPGNIRGDSGIIIKYKMCYFRHISDSFG